MYYYNGLIFVMFISFVYGERDLFEKKCKRGCNTEHGTFDCWERTTDGFAYGLSTAMIDYCQVILQLRQMNSQSWYNISRDILIREIDNYDLNKKVHQLTKNDIELVAISLLNQCFSASSSSQSSFQPSCPSCTNKQTQLIKQWRLLIIIFTCICLLFFLLILLLYFYHIRRARRSYESIR